jgi:peptidoglycan hydrolase-like protein with peptidoglycan-binding domain
MGLLRGRIVALAAVIAALLAAGTWFALTRASAQPKTRQDAAAHPAARHQAASHTSSLPMSVVSVTPASHARQVDGAAAIRVVFSQPLAPDSPLPSLSPSVAGSWRRAGASTLEFVPSLGYPPLTNVKLVIPGGPAGVRSAGGKPLATRVVDRFSTGTYRTLRLAQLLAQLGYLPLNWQPNPGNLPVSSTDANAQLSAAYSPPAGSFSWQPGYPSQLRRFWQGGQPGLILRGAVMAFESNQGLAMDGTAGPGVWQALLKAEAKGQNNPNGYTYAVASKASPETLTIWHNGRRVMHTLANTGIPSAPTVDGTFPVYERFVNTIMSGTNPDGSHYSDPVQYVSYFNGGDAVHYFPRGAFGFQQSLGCVELPYDQAKAAYPYLTYGSLVTVTG